MVTSAAPETSASSVMTAVALTPRRFHNCTRRGCRLACGASVRARRAMVALQACPGRRCLAVDPTGVYSTANGSVLQGMLRRHRTYVSRSGKHPMRVRVVSLYGLGTSALHDRVAS